jgi:hypothetical protein
MAHVDVPPSSLITRGDVFFFCLNNPHDDAKITNHKRKFHRIIRWIEIRLAAKTFDTIIVVDFFCILWVFNQL